jgi:hypothetical protein
MRAQSACALHAFTTAPHTMDSTVSSELRIGRRARLDCRGGAPSRHDAGHDRAARAGAGGGHREPAHRPARGEPCGPRCRAPASSRGRAACCGSCETCNRRHRTPSFPRGRCGSAPFHRAHGIIPLILKDWVRRHPHIGIYIEPGSTTALYGRVMAGELDAAILVHPTFELPKTSSWHSLRREPLVLLTPARMKVASALATIAREPFIRYDGRWWAARWPTTTCASWAFGQRSRRARWHRVHRQAGGRRAGVSVLPDWAVIGAPNRELKKWPLPPPCPARTVGVLWQRSDRAGAVGRGAGGHRAGAFHAAAEQGQRISARASTR